jgi:hypothetical protein
MNNKKLAIPYYFDIVSDKLLNNNNLKEHIDKKRKYFIHNLTKKQQDKDYIN